MASDHFAIVPMGLRRILGLGDGRVEAGSLEDMDSARGTSGRWARAIGSYAAGLFAIFLLTVLFRNVRIFNVTTIGFAFLLAILVAAALSGLGTSLMMSVVATLVYDYYFIPPINEWNVSDPQNWIALTAFVITSLVGSTLSEAVRRQTRRARLQRREAEQLYTLSQRLLSAGDSLALCKALPSDIVYAFGAKAAALYLTEGETVFHSPNGSQLIDAGRLKSALLHEGVQTGSNEGCYFVPLHLGTKVIGSLSTAGVPLSDATLESLGSLITIAIERARAVEQVEKIDALRENERLKSALLDAITHEFRTPLTSMKVSVTAMLSDLQFDREQCRDLLTMIDEGCDRLDQLIGEVSEMSRLESGEIKIHFARHSAGELIDAAISDCGSVLNSRRIECGGVNREVAISADLFWAAKVLGHLIANANLYSTPGRPITIRTETKQGFVIFSVADEGPGIDQADLGRIFEKFYRGQDHRFHVPGTGMGLPISKAIVEAHGGAISVTSKPGEGSVFKFSLPIDRSLE